MSNVSIILCSRGVSVESTVLPEIVCAVTHGVHLQQCDRYTAANARTVQTLYEAYQQRETETKISKANAISDKRNRFASLTSDWINRPGVTSLQDEQATSWAAASVSKALDNGLKTHTAHTKDVHVPAASAATGPLVHSFQNESMLPEAQSRRDARSGEGVGLQSGMHGNGLSRRAAGPLAGAFSRSVGLVTSLAQRMLRSRKDTGEAAHSKRSAGSALLNELLQLDSKEACQQALMIAALHQTFISAGAGPAARQEMVAQMVKTGVVSSCVTTPLHPCHVVFRMQRRNSPACCCVRRSSTV
jgi:hypothetical protein